MSNPNVTKSQPSTSANTSSSSLQSNSNVSAVNIQKIAFWQSNPCAWFKVIDNQFSAARITDELTKFNHVMSMLDPDTIQKCMDLIETSDPAETPYSSFKEQAIRRMSESEQSRLQKVLRGTDLGDRKPSELLCHMKALAGESLQGEVLKTLWLQRLPQQVRSILAISSENIENLAMLGDKIMETLPNQIASATSSANACYGDECSEPITIEQQISKLTKKFEQFQRNFSNNDRNKYGRSRSRTRSQSRSRSKESVCYYHRKFGDQARNCTNWCQYKNKNQSNSGNASTGQ